MLSKQVCKKCHLESIFHSWNYSEEDNWNRNWVYCIKEKVGIDTKNDVPKSCKFEFEHKILSQNICDLQIA